MSAQSYCAVLILGTLVSLAQPADAATIRRHLPCAAIYFSLTGPLGGGGSSSSVNIRNSLSSTIPAGTSFGYSMPGLQGSYRSSADLAPGGVLNVQNASITQGGTCDAWFNDNRVLNNINLNNLQQLQMQPSN